MFQWLRKAKYRPTVSGKNPGLGSEVKMGFSNSEATWSEEVDLLDVLSELAETFGARFRINDKWLKLENGFWLQPQIVSVEPQEPSGVKAATTIQICHETKLPGGLFEYQHAAGDDTRSAISEGFRSWWEFDYPVFEDSIARKPNTCTHLDFKDEKSKHRARRVVLGPPAHYASKKLANEEEHPFCPCCLITNCFEAFREYFQNEGNYGVRLFALRDQNGEVDADCRVNGEDWAKGKEALIAYGKTWPDRGYEFRKQFCLFDTKNDSDSTVNRKGRKGVGVI